MSFLDGWRHRLRSLFNARQHERDLSDELAFHVEREAAQQQHNARGALSNDCAVSAARKQVGNLTWALEETRQVAGVATLDAFRQDMRFAVRSFRSTPMFTAIVIATLAIGIGFSAAIFSAVDALLLRPLPFREPDRLVSVSLTLPALQNRRAADDVRWSYPKYLAFRRSQQVFSDVTVWTQSQFTLRARDVAFRLDGEYTDAHYLRTLGIPLALGSDFADMRDIASGADPELILGHSFWRNALNADSAIVGKTVQVDGHPYVVVGVAAPDFRGVSGGAQFWMPAASAPQSWENAEAYNHKFFLVGRIAPGISVEQAQQATATLGAQVNAQFPPKRVADAAWGAVARELDAARASPFVQRMLFVLSGAVILMLLTACANVANLLLVRATSRQREIAVRLALGATRARLARQLLAESVLLASAGGAASLFVGFASVKLLASVQTLMLGRTNSMAGLGTVYFSEIRFDLTTFAVTAALSLCTGIVFGFAPALHATRTSLLSATKDAGAGVQLGRRMFSLRHGLTIAEITCAVVLLAASGLMIRSVNQLMAVRPGFDSSNTLALRVNRAADWSRDSIDAYYDGALDRISKLSGIQNVAMADCPPLNRCESTGVFRGDRPRPEEDRTVRAGFHWISPDWPTTLKIPLKRGRLFTRSDDSRSPPVVLISETAASRLWPGEDPVGRPIMFTNGVFQRDTAYVVGVLGDVLYDSMDSNAQPEIYVSYFQTHFTYRMMFFVRSAPGAQTVAPRVVGALRAYAPGFPVHELANLDRRMTDSIAHVRVTAGILTAFACVALLLATMGTYGVVAYSVSQRTREISVRVALGATNANIARLVMWQGLSLAAVGLGTGLGAAFVATRVLRSFLFGVAPTDFVTLTCIMLLLMASVLAATLIPARRALRVMPSAVLRAH